MTLPLVGSGSVWREPADPRPAASLPLGSASTTRTPPPSLASSAGRPRLASACVVMRDTAEPDPRGDVPVGAPQATRAPLPTLASAGARLAGSCAVWDEPAAADDAGAQLTLGEFVDAGSGDWTVASSGTPAAVLVADAQGDYTLVPVASADPAARRADVLVTPNGDFLIH